MSAVTVTPIDGWSPDQYERFRSERQQPFDDLLMLCHPSPVGVSSIWAAGPAI